MEKEQENWGKNRTERETKSAQKTNIFTQNRLKVREKGRNKRGKRV